MAAQNGLDADVGFYFTDVRDFTNDTSKPRHTFDIVLLQKAGKGATLRDVLAQCAEGEGIGLEGLAAQRHEGADVLVSEPPDVHGAALSSSASWPRTLRRASSVASRFQAIVASFRRHREMSPAGGNGPRML